MPRLVAVIATGLTASALAAGPAAAAMPGEARSSATAMPLRSDAPSTMQAPGPVCQAFVSANFRGLPGAPKTINYSGLTDCTEVYPAVGVTSQAKLYDSGFRFEDAGNFCSSVYDCKSSGSYFAALGTLPGSTHIIEYKETLTLSDPAYVWTSGGSECTGYGTPTLSCTNYVSIQVPA